MTETVASARGAERPRRRRRRWVVAAAVLLLLAASAVEVRSVLWFSSAAPWSPGERVHVCGRDFQRAGLVPAARAEAPVSGVALQRVSSGPLFQPLYGHPAPASYRALGAPCTMDLYVHEGAGYREYGLVGGP